ncbi:hypothetical protein ARMGADRAFT_1066894 [Armillaria gallica]|uniref:Uncharacterized protein n=1 Tax=Armillaria gallica TaxID=47427 RepID=A0A2H3CRV0_ARMGA|nr:hypothetical protein ARMGADRAFT_1066894 [Armillaria gallica]
MLTTVPVLLLQSCSWHSKFLTSPSMEKSSEQHSFFTEGNCIIAADSAAIISFHLRHINFMVNLVEGSLRHDTSKYAIYSNTELDEDREAFVDNFHTLCKLSYQIKRHYRLYLIHKSFTSFGPWGMSPVLNPVEVVIKSLNRAAEHEALMETASLRVREKYAIKFGNILRPSLDRFFADICVVFTELAAGVPPMMELFANCSSYRRLVSEGLDIDIPRVAEYANHPVTPIISKYCYNSTEKPLTADELAQSVVNVKARLDHDYYGDHLDIPPRRLIGLHLSLPFNDDSFVDESVDSDGL